MGTDVAETGWGRRQVLRGWSGDRDRYCVDGWDEDKLHCNLGTPGGLYLRSHDGFSGKKMLKLNNLLYCRSPVPAQDHAPLCLSICLSVCLSVCLCAYIIQQQATGTATGSKLSRRELNVLQTMITVIACFIVFWAPGSVNNVLRALTVCYAILKYL